MREGSSQLTLVSRNDCLLAPLETFIHLIRFGFHPVDPAALPVHACQKNTHEDMFFNVKTLILKANANVKAAKVNRCGANFT